MFLSFQRAHSITPKKIDQSQGRLPMSLHVKFHSIQAKRQRLKNLLQCSSFMTLDQSSLVSSQSFRICKIDSGASIHLPHSISEVMHLLTLSSFVRSLR